MANKIRINPHVGITSSGFLFNSKTGDSYTVNPIGAEIIKMIRDGHSEEEIKRTIVATYDCDDETFEKDYYDFVNMLLKHQIALPTDKDQPEVRE